MSKFVILLCAVLGFAAASPEKPGPYPPKGWKPQGARLELPRQYGTPQVQKNAPEEVEFTTVVNEYLPPTTVQSDANDVLRVQGLPAADSVSEFRNFQQKKAANVRVQPQAARIQFAPAPAFAGQPLLLSPVFAPQFAPVSGQLQEQRFNQQVQSFNNPQSEAQQVPTQAYGPPQTFNPPPQANVPRTNEPEVVQNEEPDSSESDENEDQDESVIAVSNAVSNGDAAQGQVGQYYLLLPDNSLQKVRFATKQTDEDRQINGFSAQLRWAQHLLLHILTV